MKKIGIGILVFIIIVLSWTCHGDQETKREIEGFVEKQEKYVNEANLEKYMDTLSIKSSEYVAEKRSWMVDIRNNNVDNYRLKIKKIKILDEDHAELDLTQSYVYKDKKYKAYIPLLLVKENGFWKDGDLRFNELETEHFKIKYFSKDEEEAKYLKVICEEAYKNVSQRYGESIQDITLIKLYEDHELLRQSVKLSFGWQFAGWYEYPESIKTTIFEDKEIYREIIEHELIHKITIKDGNNNLPYWFTEGLAVYFANFPNEPKKFRTKEYYLEKYKDRRMNIESLEKANLEKMENKEEIENYYESAGMIVEFMIDRYGLVKVKKIVEELGKYPYQEGTGAEVDHEAVTRFHKVLPKVLGIDVKNLDKIWEAYLYKG